MVRSEDLALPPLEDDGCNYDMPGLPWRRGCQLGSWPP